MIPSGVILPFNGAHASIPSGWTRETALDGLYPKAWSASVAPNNTGGANTHSHSSTAHGHTLNAHSHSCSYGLSNETVTENVYDDEGISRHQHNDSTISTTSGGALQDVAVTWDSVNQEPPYYTVIFIKPSGSFAFLSANILAYFNRLVNPSGWKLCDGNAGAPDLRGKYLKGATTGGNAGTTGGGTTHTHSITHGHTANAHSHSGNTGSPSNFGYRDSNGGTGRASDYHTHTVALANATDTTYQYTNASAGGDSIDLAYKKLAIFTHSGGGMIKGLVAMWLGGVTTIPIGWKLCDGNNGTLDLRDKFIKAGQDITQNNNSGGNNSHSHSSVSHSHITTGNHSHTGSTGSLSSQCTGGSGTDGAVVADHSHAVTVGSAGAVYANGIIDCASVDHQPAYRTVAYIEYQFSAGGSFLLGIV